MTDTTKPFYFRRFVDGQEMAEEVQIIGAASLDEAIKTAARICPKREMTVLVHSPLIPDYAAALAAGNVVNTVPSEEKRGGSDTARLDFMLANDAFIAACNRDGSILQYQLMTQDEDENYHYLHNERRFFNTKREAIDAAMEAARTSTGDKT